jgi:hypothetical protein
MRDERRGAVQRLIENLGGENDLPDECPQEPAASRSEMCFKAPSLRQVLRSSGAFWVLVGAFCIMLVFSLVPLFVFLPDEPFFIKLALVGVVVVCPCCLLMLMVVRTHLLGLYGRIILKDDRLVEYDLFNYKRVYSYDQIYRVKRSSRGGVPVIGYYVCGQDGQIDYNHIQEVKLIKAHRNRQMMRELQNRIAAPCPGPRVESRFLNRTGLFGILFIASSLFVIVAYVMWPTPWIGCLSLAIWFLVIWGAMFYGWVASRRGGIPPSSEEFGD